VPGDESCHIAHRSIRFPLVHNEYRQEAPESSLGGLSISRLLRCVPAYSHRFKAGPVDLPLRSKQPETDEPFVGLQSLSKLNLPLDHSYQNARPLLSLAKNEDMLDGSH
jgi:hypothetical protein